MAKQAALAFVKRTIDRCCKFEDTGKSCFSEQLFKDIFLSGYSYLNGGRSGHDPTDVEAAKPCPKTSNNSLEVRVSGILSLEIISIYLLILSSTLMDMLSNKFSDAPRKYIGGVVNHS